MRVSHPITLKLLNTGQCKKYKAHEKARNNVGPIPGRSSELFAFVRRSTLGQSQCRAEIRLKHSGNLLTCN